MITTFASRNQRNAMFVQAASAKSPGAKPSPSSQSAAANEQPSDSFIVVLLRALSAVHS